MQNTVKCGTCRREAEFRTENALGERFYMCAGGHVTRKNGEQQKAARTTAHARRTDPDTSHAAAASITEDQLRASQAAVLELFRAFDDVGATDQKVARHYEARRKRAGWPSQSASGLRTRRKELVDAGFLEDSGYRETLESGRKSIVWRVAG